MSSLARTQLFRTRRCSLGCAAKIAAKIRLWANEAAHKPKQHKSSQSVGVSQCTRAIWSVAVIDTMVSSHKQSPQGA
jgi:hypothetical protein